MTKETNIKSDKNALHKAEAFLNDFKSEYLSGHIEGFMNVLIAYTEAVNNAINHGNKKDPDKNINIQIDIRENLLTIIVEDEGQGFYTEKVPDPTLPENLLKDSGRGVFLIKKLSNEVKYSKSEYGTIVNMEFNI